MKFKVNTKVAKQQNFTQSGHTGWGPDIHKHKLNNLIFLNFFYWNVIVMATCQTNNFKSSNSTKLKLEGK